MIPLRPVDVELARAWVDFKGRSDAAGAFAETQLEGAVALHNLLAKERFAYLADEVGMGKTYIAIGAMALMRRRHPEMRVLYIAPKANIQANWLTTLRNFAANNWRADDARIRSLGGSLAFPVVSCENLRDLATAAVLNDRRDFLMRMSSFSLGMPKNPNDWAARRDEVLRLMPWLDRNRFSLYNKARFKDAYARAVNAALPRFDLVIVDEGHNLKHGFGENVSARNRLLGLVLGRPDESVPCFPGGGVRADRVLVLSATPIEHDFTDMWNQMDLLGFGDVAPELRDSDRSDAERQAIAARFLVRRLTRIEVGGQPLTKNLYRREWRGGGVSNWDSHLPVADASQRLIVALMQKRVSEVLRRSDAKSGTHFKRSFQIGMLASFESFFQTTKVTVKAEGGDEVEAAYEESDQARGDDEKQGLDARAVDDLAASWHRTFRTPMPHPKMDAVAEEAAAAMIAGEKTLIFVRRIASVPELTRKIGHIYDRWLRDYLTRGTNEPLSREIEAAFAEYESTKRLTGTGESGAPEQGSVGDDAGGEDTFFAWFFRGERRSGETGYRCMASTFRKNRLRSEGSRHATLIEENHALRLLGAPVDVVAALLSVTGSDPGRLRALAWGCFRSDRQGRFPRALVFEAYQEAALRLIVSRGAPAAAEAQVILRELFPTSPPLERRAVPEGFPGPADALGTRTLFTELEARASLCEELWPTSDSPDVRARVREREQRRQILVSSLLLGHPFIDLWLCAVARVGSLASDRDDEAAGSLATEFLDRLEAQRGTPGLSSWRELRRLAEQFDLLVDVNFSEMRVRDVTGLAKFLSPTFGRQSPVGGMWGGVNKQLVSQFRLPGYPYVLVTTDVLREGENLHTWCARIQHYGIGWTPSSMEQRTGRIDRIGSLTHRRLATSDAAEPEKLLQVFYPHLHDTVERVQVREVYRRMNRFIDLMHERADARRNERSEIDLASAILEADRDVAPIAGLLLTRFEIRPEWLCGDRDAPNVSVEPAITAFEAIVEALRRVLPVTFGHADGKHIRQGTLAQVRRSGGQRQQPFQLELRPVRGSQRLVIRMTSPVGVVGWHARTMADRLLASREVAGGIALCAVPRDSVSSFDLFARMDLLFDQATSATGELADALGRLCRVADLLEEQILATDQPLSTFAKQLSAEVAHG
jgi:hypothetical protein